MSETKFTQGPWVAKQDPDGSPDDWCIGIEDGKIDQVAVCGKSDAPLIAAAPELYAAGSRVTAAFRALGVEKTAIGTASCRHECESAIMALDAAIQKATKEPT